MFVEGKVVLITGAAGEIGAAIARHMAEGGARVALADRNAKGVRELASQIGGGATWHECDVSDDQSMAQTIAAAERAHGRIDIGAGECVAVVVVARDVADAGSGVIVKDRAAHLSKPQSFAPRGNLSVAAAAS